ncbi:hypothetical protein Tco_0705369 [Tanacetum coccineum]|uniref:Uncharacterized protein n=1 Tax=Tanacetum coccineum TaxID=301880 RepID=A0ABQ4Y6E4_9ASTR
MVESKKPKKKKDQIKYDADVAQRLQAELDSLVYRLVVGYVLPVDRLLVLLLYQVEVDSLCWILYLLVLGIAVLFCVLMIYAANCLNFLNFGYGKSSSFCSFLEMKKPGLKDKEKKKLVKLQTLPNGMMKYWKIIRVANHTEVHHFFDDMLKAFNRDDLGMLWSLVKEKFNLIEPTDDKEREIWVELKRLFEPDTYDELWKLQKHIHDLNWKLYDLCEVHHMSTEKGIDIYMLVEKEYPLSRGTLTLMLVAKLLVDQDNEMSRELLRKIVM